MTNKILSVTQINEYVRATLDSDPLLASVAVKGEISNYKLYPSGHHYFTLKDDGGALKCVMFRGSAAGMRFRPENGMKVIATGRVSVYPRDGAYQLYCNSLVPDGVGDLYIAFEQLKKKLSAEGLFDAEHKKKIPQFPKTICIITSSAGAAVHDMLRILAKRFPLTQVCILPVRVQGQEAPEEIASAITYANHYELADLLIVGRGGGSIEDLWAFNDERVARAIYASKIPVISAVGHEPDVTISDFVADLRAATPSNAAELAVPDQEALLQTLDSMSIRINNAITRQLRACKQHLDSLSSNPMLQDVAYYVRHRRDQLSTLNTRLIASQNNNLNKKRQIFIAATAKLDALSPLKVLSRGYAVVRGESGDIVKSVDQVKQKDRIDIRLIDGTLTANITNKKERSL